MLGELTGGRDEPFLTYAEGLASASDCLRIEGFGRISGHHKLGLNSNWI